MKGMDFLTPYVTTIFGFIGVTDIKVVFGYQTRAVDQGDKTLAEYVAAHTISA